MIYQQYIHAYLRDNIQTVENEHETSREKREREILNMRRKILEDFLSKKSRLLRALTFILVGMFRVWIDDRLILHQSQWLDFELQKK